MCHSNELKIKNNQLKLNMTSPNIQEKLFKYSYSTFACGQIISDYFNGVKSGQKL